MHIVAELHATLAQTVMYFLFAIGVWGLFEYIRGGELGGSIGGAFVIGQVLVVVQVLLGIVILAGGFTVQSVHFLYGISAIISLPFAWSYMRARNPRQALVVYSLVALFVCGLAIRGIITGGA
jgi:heme A synthase